MTVTSESDVIFRTFVAAPPEPEPRARAVAFMAGGKMRARVHPVTRGKPQLWREELARALKPFVPSIPWEGPLGLILDFRFARPLSHLRKNGQLRESVGNVKATKPDLDNLEKLVMDVITRAGIWRDDGQVGCKYSRKLYVRGGERPGVEVILWRVPPSET